MIWVIKCTIEKIPIPKYFNKKNYNICVLKNIYYFLHELAAIIIPILHMKNLRLREVKCFAQGLYLEGRAKLDPGLCKSKSLCLTLRSRNHLIRHFSSFLRKVEELILGKGGTRQYVITLHNKQLKFEGRSVDSKRLPTALANHPCPVVSRDKFDN